MMRGLRIAALFAVYGSIGFGGDYVAGLVAQETGYDLAVVPSVAENVEAQPVVDVVVDVRPSISVRVQSDCSYTDGYAAVVQVDGDQRLMIDAGSGDLRVEEGAASDEIRVEAAYCASQEAWLNELRVTLNGSGDDIILQTHYPDRRDVRGDNTAKIDLVVMVPRGLSVAIHDSSGDMEVSGTGDLLIDDSSGSISVRGIDGSVLIEDSSGGIRVTDVVGDLRIEDSSGGVDVRSVTGSVSLRDGSGGIDVAEVGEHVYVESDGSGSIDVRAIGGDFVVERDGSGGIQFSDVAGAVDVPEDKRRKRRRRPGR